MASTTAARGFRLTLARFLGYPDQRSMITWSQYTKMRAFSATASEGTSAEGQEITLSDSCVEQLKRITGSSGTMLRVTVDGGGCSGFQYKFDLDSSVKQDDRVFERGGARVVVDQLSLSMMSGATIDHHQELIRSSFRVVNNPNSELSCSCGASFALK